MSTLPIQPQPQENVENSKAVNTVNTVPPVSSEMDPKKIVVKSLADLREQSPESYEATLKSIASNIIDAIRRSSDRLRKIMKEARQQQ